MESSGEGENEFCSLYVHSKQKLQPLYLGLQKGLSHPPFFPFTQRGRTAIYYHFTDGDQGTERADNKPSYRQR